MTKEEIKSRILAEYGKHPELDWAELAARKIYASILSLEKGQLESAFDAGIAYQFDPSQQSGDSGELNFEDWFKKSHPELKQKI